MTLVDQTPSFSLAQHAKVFAIQATLEILLLMSVSHVQRLAQAVSKINVQGVTTT